MPWSEKLSLYKSLVEENVRAFDSADGVASAMGHGEEGE
jgi:hypothetical protein